MKTPKDMSDIEAALLGAEAYEDEQRAWNDLRAKLRAAETLVAQQAKRADAALAQAAELRRALETCHEGAARQLAEPRNHDDDQFALTAIATTAESALALSPGEALERIKQEAMGRMRDVAIGCHDYGGGYHDPKQAAIFHHGIQTVINALDGRMESETDPQSNALEMMGRAAELRKGEK